jgi:hypothetical protein
MDGLRNVALLAALGVPWVLSCSAGSAYSDHGGGDAGGSGGAAGAVGSGGTGDSGVEPPPTGGSGGQNPDAGPLVPNGDASSRGIRISPTRVLHAARSHVLGANRNHVKDEVPEDFPAMLSAVRALKPANGGRKLYRLGHGVTDGRKDYGYMPGYHFESAWDKAGPYPYDDIRHGLGEAKELDTDVIMVVNFGSGDAAEAGRLASYLNKASDATRTSQGLPPFNVKLFEIGNEIGWSQVIGHDEYASSESAYATRAKAFATQMRANSDIPIQIGASASINSNWQCDGWSDGPTAVGKIIDIMGEDVDFLIFHGYPSYPLKKDGDPLTFMAQNEWNKSKLKAEILPAIAAARQRNGISHPIGVANTEYSTELYAGPWLRGVLEALYTADTVVTSLELDVQAAVNFALWHHEHGDSLFFLENSSTKRTPIFATHELLASALGAEVVEATAHGMPSINVQGGSAGTEVNLPQLSFVAMRSATGSVTLTVVNRLEGTSVGVPIDAGMAVRQATLVSLLGTQYTSTSMTRRETQLTSLANVEFPAASVSVLRLSP